MGFEKWGKKKGGGGGKKSVQGRVGGGVGRIYGEIIIQFDMGFNNINSPQYVGFCYLNLLVRKAKLPLRESWFSRKQMLEKTYTSNDREKKKKKTAHSRPSKNIGIKIHNRAD